MYKKIFAVLMLLIMFQEAIFAADNNLSIPSVNQAADDEFGDEFDDEFDDEFGDDESLQIRYDPLGGFNRVMTTFNDKLFDTLLEPVVFKSYKYVVSEPVRASVNNFFNNLYYPVSLINNLLQLKFEEAHTETLRFIINTTFGIGGLFDTARDGLGIEAKSEDFGQTLGHYGVGSGFHIVLPLFGPTNLRDLGSTFVDFYASPIYYVKIREYNIVASSYEGWSAVTYRELNRFSLYDREYKLIRRDAIDLYPYIRDAYEQQRDRDIGE